MRQLIATLFIHFGVYLAQGWWPDAAYVTPVPPRKVREKQEKELREKLKNVRRPLPLRIDLDDTMDLPPITQAPIKEAN